jgi:repressor LexA
MARTSPSVQVTPKQLLMLKQIGLYQANPCYSATIGELAQSLGISRATAYEHIAALREKKLLVQSTGKARSLRLTSKGESLLQQALQLEQNTETVAPPLTNSGSASEEFYLRGRVSAGYGIDAIEEQTPFSLSDVFGHKDDVFVLQVSGQSMIDAGINDGDFVMCKYARTAGNGQLVIALLEGETATLKRFYLDKRAARLMPENDAFEPIFATDCQIQAVVVGLVRQM